MDINKRLAEEFNIKLHQVENTVKLIDEGNTIPFIARYRKEATGSLDDQLLRNLNDRLVYLRSMEERKEEIKRLIDEQGKLTEELVLAIDTCEKLTELEDIYRPYRPKRRTRAKRRFFTFGSFHHSMQQLPTHDDFAVAHTCKRNMDRQHP